MQLHLLEEVVERTSKKHPHYTSARIIDILSELANTTVKDSIMLNGLRMRKQHGYEEKKYLATPLIYVTDASQYIPRHPWFVRASNAENNSWQMKNITNGSTFSVSKKQIGDFYEYAIEKLH